LFAFLKDHEVLINGVFFLLYQYIWQIDMAALKQMGEHDLKELGIPMV